MKPITRNSHKSPAGARLAILLILGACLAVAWAQQANRQSPEPRATSNDAVMRAQEPAAASIKRPEQQKTAHDRSGAFSATQAEPSSPDFKIQAKEGKITGFDFYRDPLNADKPFQSFEEIMQKESANRPKVKADQLRLLESRYNLQPKLDPSAKMSRGKPLAIGPTARLPRGMGWETLAGMTPDAIRQQGIFPYPALPHPLQSNGGQVFPAMQIEMFPRLERFDVEFDLPDAFIPEFPPAIFLSSRPELGDVSRGEIVSLLPPV